MNLLQHLHDLAAQFIQLGVDFLQRPRRFVLVEMAVERDLVADHADLLVAALRVFVPVDLVAVDPCVLHVRGDFFAKVGFVHRVHVRAAGGLNRQRHVFVVSQVAVGFEFDQLAAVLEDAVGWVGLLFGTGANAQTANDFLDDWLGGGVGPTDGGEDGFLLLGVQFDIRVFDGLLESGFKFVEVVVLVGADDGLQAGGDVEQFFLGDPCFGVEQVFDLLFFQVGKVGFDEGADFGFDSEVTVGGG